jgi:hypothetical protein
MVEPESSTSRRRTRLSLSCALEIWVWAGSRVEGSRRAADEEGDLEVVLLELGEGFPCREVDMVREVGFRASRQAVVRREGSSSEKM